MGMILPRPWCKSITLLVALFSSYSHRRMVCQIGAYRNNVLPCVGLIDMEWAVKKLLICKTCLIGFAALLLACCGETIATVVKKSSAFIYEHTDNVAGKDEVTGCLVLERCEAMKNFYLCKLCVIVFGALLATLT